MVTISSLPKVNRIAVGCETSMLCLYCVYRDGGVCELDVTVALSGAPFENAA